MNTKNMIQYVYNFYSDSENSNLRTFSCGKIWLYGMVWSMHSVALAIACTPQLQPGAPGMPMKWEILSTNKID